MRNILCCCRLLCVIVIIVNISDRQNCGGIKLEQPVPHWKWSFDSYSNGSSTVVPYKKCRKTCGRVSLVTYVDERGLKIFPQTISSLRCYAKTRGYDFYLLKHEDFDDDDVCGKYKDIMFRRHCVVATTVLPKYDWILFLDADNVVANPFHCVEEYIDGRYDLIHTERFYNGEIQAGNYIVKNSSFSVQYLLEWASYYSYHSGYPRNKDNGALHLHLLQHITQKNISELPCKDLWSWGEDYTSYISCFQKELNGKRVFDRVKIYRRGHGPVRDGSNSNSQWCVKDFILHGYKEVYYHKEIFPLYRRKISSWDCVKDSWEIPYNRDKFVSITKIRDKLISINDFYLDKLSKHSAGLNGERDTPLCWPFCHENLKT